MKKVFNKTGDFAAISEAQKWLKDEGYSFGSMQREAPIGIMKGDYSISKWRGLSRQDIAELDGVIEGIDKRNGPVTITIFDSVDNNRPSFNW